jgi:hypothetical protein
MLTTVERGFFVDFGVVATIGAATVTGIFDVPTAETFGMLGTDPTFTCAAADVPGIAAGQAVTINAVAYTVTAVRPDGTGVTVLTLEKAA